MVGMDCPIIRLSECTTAVVTLATGVAEQADAQRQEKGTESDHKESDQQGSAAEVRSRIYIEISRYLNISINQFVLVILCLNLYRNISIFE